MSPKKINKIFPAKVVITAEMIANGFLLGARATVHSALKGVIEGDWLDSSSVEWDKNKGSLKLPDGQIYYLSTVEKVNFNTIGDPREVAFEITGCTLPELDAFFF